MRKFTGAIPGRKWFFYAALRLGTFVMIYFLLVGVIAFLLGAGAITMIALIPIFVFVAIRLSGNATDEYRPKNDYTNDAES